MLTTTETVESLQAELAEMREQRDALAHVVAKCWDAAIEGLSVDGGEVQQWMAEVGLVEEGEATAEEAASNPDFEEGDQWFRFTDMGRSAMAGTGHD